MTLSNLLYVFNLFMLRELMKFNNNRIVLGSSTIYIDFRMATSPNHKNRFALSYYPYKYI